MSEQINQCSWCKFSKYSEAYTKHVGIDRYECKINPPVFNDNSQNARWPIVSCSDWCGKFERKE